MLHFCAMGALQTALPLCLLLSAPQHCACVRRSAATAGPWLRNEWRLLQRGCMKHCVITSVTCSSSHWQEKHWPQPMCHTQALLLLNGCRRVGRCLYRHCLCFPKLVRCALHMHMLWQVKLRALAATATPTSGSRQATYCTLPLLCLPTPCITYSATPRLARHSNSVKISSAALSLLA